MRKIKYIPGCHDTVKEYVNHRLDISDCDDYAEYIMMLKKFLYTNKKVYEEGKTKLGECGYYLFKQEVEELFRRRDEISTKELKEYTSGTMYEERWGEFRNLERIYYDVYKDDPEFHQELLKENLENLEKDYWLDYPDRPKDGEEEV